MAKPNDRTVVIQLPDEQAIRGGFGREGLEDLVKAMLGGQVGRGIDNVIVRGGRAGAGAGEAANWMKTIWSRAC